MSFSLDRQLDAYADFIRKKVPSRSCALRKTQQCWYCCKLSFTPPSSTCSCRTTVTFSMEPRILEGSNIDQVDLRVINVEGDLHQHGVQVEGRSECRA
jgi:hypothetical protein